MSRNSYNTKQKDIIINIIKNYNKRFCVRDIYDLIREDTSLTTLYRVIDKMLSDGKLSKYIDKDNNTYYQYINECSCLHHFYLRCDNCGEITHVNCDCVDELFNHITDNHKFIPNNESFIIGGVCNNCKGVK